MPGIQAYPRVSTGDQDVADAIRVFTDEMSGKGMERPGLAELLAYAQEGDTLAIVGLDRSLGKFLTPVQVRR